MFEGLERRLGDVFRRLGSRGRLSPTDIDEALREVRVALLEADVSFAVARDFVKDLKGRLEDERVAESLTPHQTVIRAVRQELESLLGDSAGPWHPSGPAPRIVLLMGLQGAGKTSFAQKLGVHLKGRGEHPLLVAADLRRPAAREQLMKLGEAAGVPVAAPPGTDPVAVVRQALKEAGRRSLDTVIVDTSGRTDLDGALIEELKGLNAALGAPSRLLVADAMTGQAAVDLARAFDEAVGVTGIVLTKMDGDARGGAALSMRRATGRPILFLATGEGPSALEVFHPDRLASRILGMGDVLTLIEKAEAAAGSRDLAGKALQMKREGPTLDDLVEQMRSLRKMGSLRDVLGMVPGLSKLAGAGGLDVDERQMARTEAIVLSMTLEERRQPGIIDASRKRRIARGSGTSVQDVNGLLRRFEEMRRFMKVAGTTRRGPGLPPGVGMPLPRGRPRRGKRR